MPKSVLLKVAIENSKNRLSKSDRMLAEQLLNSYSDSVFSSVSEMAQKTGLSKSTVGRFFRKIGFNSFENFRQALREEMNQFLTSSPAERFAQLRTRNYSLDELIDIETENIRRTLKGVDQTQLSNFVNELCRPNRSIYIGGERKNWPIAFLLYVQLHWLLPSVRPIFSTGGFMPDYVLDIGSEDIIIVFCFRRYPKTVFRLVSALRYQNRWNGVIALITDSPNCPISPLSNYNFIVETESLSLFDSHTAAVTLINAILLDIIDQNPDVTKDRSERVEFLSNIFDLYYSKEETK